MLYYHFNRSEIDIKLRIVEDLEVISILVYVYQERIIAFASHIEEMI